MALPSSSALSISMAQINTELNLSASATISLNDTVVRTLLARPGASTTISMADGYGKVNSINATTLSSNKQNLNIYNEAVAAGWDRSSPFVYTIGSGVYVWTDSTSLAALDTGGAFPNGLAIINNGYIMGKGGDGCWKNSYLTSDTANATPGGTAINITTNCTITNNSYLGGGGGGGGGEWVYRSYFNDYYQGSGAGGGGAGGGKGGSAARYSSGTMLGGAGGAVGQAGGNGQTDDDVYNGTHNYRTSGGGGGRIMPGTGGTGGSAGSGQSLTAGSGGGSGGGGGAYAFVGNSQSGWAIGGAGGGADSAGNSGSGSTDPNNGIDSTSGGGGGWGASGGTGGGRGLAINTQAGAAGGKAINTNTYRVTTIGTIYGGVG